jgi:saccharopine dehydrogenase-like NADP-dependent oxidoreductase
MKKVLILGAGMVARPMVSYLLDKNYRVTIASRTKEKADLLIQGHPNGHTVGWTVDDKQKLEELIGTHDLTVSLLPYAHHVTVAKKCLKFKKNMVTTSYVLPEMKELDEAARKAGIIILNELGVDPGIDHMSAKRIIDNIHKVGGKIEEFYSFTGALVAPEVEKNPFNYKFTWAPRGVVLAGNNDGRYLKNGEEVYVPTEDLFKHPVKIYFPGVGELEAYPNRNSLPYQELYGIPEAKTVFRGTLRYGKWCEIMDTFKSLNLLSSKEYNLNGWSTVDFVAHLSGISSSENIKPKLARKLHVKEDADPIKAMEWIGLLSDQPVNAKTTTPLDLVSDLMIDKMMIGDDERDMVAMQHTFHVKYPDGRREIITSEMLDFGTIKTDTSIARTVTLPAACGVEMILERKIDLIGVHIPVISEIYNPILDNLEKMGIKMEEKYGLEMTMDVN